ncbi:MAG: DUF5009 domain-containing protein [Bryobacteraceae bacterium]|jgi:predicted acyltransferase
MTPTSVAPSLEPVLETPASTPRRLLSLDAFRGLTMALMVLVNNNGSERDAYTQLRHSQWNGWTLTDTVFPTFLWIVGVAITLSLGKRLAEGIPRARLLPQIFRRAAILFAFGLAVYAPPLFDLGTQRILGVLQRIAICYLVVSILFLYTGLRAQICWLIGLLAAYWMLMTLVPAPGFGPGRLDEDGNFAHYIDRMVLGSHNYRETKTWDPEGIVSTLPAIATTLFGVLAGHLLRLRRSLPERMTWLFLAGNLLLAAGAICSYWLPINKKLWTDSFCLFMAGLDFVVFAMFAWLVDGLGWHKPVRPLVILGMNAIAVYMAAEFSAEAISSIRWNAASGHISLQHYLYRTLFAPLASPAIASLLYSLVFTGAMYLVAYAMHRKGWYLRV